MPEPSGGGEESTRGYPNSSRATAAPQMSMMESTAPTSWKWISSRVTPWTFASASPRRRNTLDALSFARSDSWESKMRASISRQLV